MKTIVTFLTLILFSAAVFAQEEPINDQPQTIFSGGTKLTGWFIGFNHSYSRINGKYSYLPGFSGGIIMNRNFMIGFTGKSLTCYENYLRYDNLFDETVYLEGGYGGLYLEATPFYDKVVHVSFPVIIGGGGAAYISKEKYLDYEDDDWDFERIERSSSPLFVIEPGVKLEVNVTGFMKLYSGFSYRWTQGLRLEKTSRNALNGCNFSLGLKFGKF